MNRGSPRRAILAHILVAWPAGDEDADGSEDRKNDEGDENEPILEMLA